MGKERDHTEDEIRALKYAVWRTDPTFFGLIFDCHMARLNTGQRPYAERTRKALDLTMVNPIIQRAGIETVIQFAQTPSWSDRYLSPAARDALDSYTNYRSSKVELPAPRVI